MTYGHGSYGERPYSTTSGVSTGPQTLAVLACIITFSAPAATIQPRITLAAGQNTITITAPAATAHLGFTLAAGSNTITLSAPTATLKAAITRAAGSNTVTITAPVAARVAVARLPAGIQIVTLTAPPATILGGGPLAPPPPAEGQIIFWGKHVFSMRIGPDTPTSVPDPDDDWITWL